MALRQQLSQVITFTSGMKGLNGVFHLKDLYKIATEANAYTATEVILNGGICMCFISLSNHLSIYLDLRDW